MNESNNDTPKCNFCTLPYCEGDSWHRAQETDYRTAASYGHPSLILKYFWANAKHAGEVRRKRKKEWEEQNQAKKKTQSSIDSDNSEVNSVDYSKVHSLELFHSSQTEESEVLLKGLVKLPDHETPKVTVCCFIGFEGSKGNTIPANALVMFLPEYNIKEVNSCYPCMIPSKLLPPKLLKKHKQWTRDAKEINKYAHVWDNSPKLQKLDKTNVFFSNELKCIINPELNHSLQNGLVFAKKGCGHFTFRLLAKKNFFVEERSNLNMTMYNVTNNWNGLGPIPISCARGQVSYQVAVDICKRTKFRIATHCASRNDLIKQLTSLEDEPATVLEKCLAYVLSGNANICKAVGRIILCPEQSNTSPWNQKVCTCDIDLTGILDKKYRKKLKKHSESHYKGKR